MTRKELRTRRAALEKAHRRLPLICFGGILVCGLGPLLVSGALHDRGYKSLANLVVWLSLFGLFFGMWLLARWGKRLIAAHGMICPSCGTSLQGLRGDLAMTTGRCEGCGEQIIEDA